MSRPVVAVSSLEEAGPGGNGAENSWILSKERNANQQNPEGNRLFRLVTFCLFLALCLNKLHCDFGLKKVLTTQQNLAGGTELATPGGNKPLAISTAL